MDQMTLGAIYIGGAMEPTMLEDVDKALHPATKHLLLFAWSKHRIKCGRRRWTARKMVCRLR